MLRSGVHDLKFVEYVTKRLSGDSYVEVKSFFAFLQIKEKMYAPGFCLTLLTRCVLYFQIGRELNTFAIENKSNPGQRIIAS